MRKQRCKGLAIDAVLGIGEESGPSGRFLYAVVLASLAISASNATLQVSLNDKPNFSASALNCARSGWLARNVSTGLVSGLAGVRVTVSTGGRL